MTLPRRIKKQSVRQSDRIRCPGHLAFVRGHVCCACKCADSRLIEAAHVRTGTDGGVGLKPSDNWALSLCSACHRLQHMVGEPKFEELFGIDMKKLAAEFAAKSDPLRRYLARKRAA